MMKIPILIALLFCVSAYGNPRLETIVIATSQFKIEGGLSNAQFFNKVTKYVELAASKQAQLFVLPEWNTLDLWPRNSKLSDRQILEQIAKTTTTPYLNLLKTLSTKFKMLIIGGSTTLEEKGAYYNAAPIVFPDGRIVYHKKVHLTKWERDQNLGRGEAATVLDTIYGKIAVLICYDSEFPDLSLELMKDRPEIILIPSMTESREGAGRVRWSVQGRVVEHTAYAAIATTNGQVGSDWHHFGKAVILGPQIPGFKPVLGEGNGESEEVVAAKINLKELRSHRTNSPWQPALDLKRRRTL